MKLLTPDLTLRATETMEMCPQGFTKLCVLIHVDMHEGLEMFYSALKLDRIAEI